MSHARKVLIAVIILFAIMIFVECKNMDLDEETAVNNDNTKATEQLDEETNETINEEIKDFTFSEGPKKIIDDGYYCVTGVLKNNTDETYTYAEVTFRVYDEDGNQIGTIDDSINYFEAGGTWKFKAKAIFIDDQDDIESYKFIKVIAF